MKSLTKKLLSIFMVLCLTLLSFGLTLKVNAVASEAYSCGFERSEGYTPENSYKKKVTLGPKGKQWVVDGGNVTTTKKITGEMSVLLRSYKDKTAHPSLTMNFTFNNVGTLTYKVKGDDSKGLNYAVYYTTDGTWNMIGDVRVATNTATTVTIDFQSLGLSGLENVKLRFAYTDANYSKDKNLNFDDISITPGKSLPKLGNPTATLDKNIVTINPVTNSEKYGIDIFAGETKVAGYYTTTSTFEIPFTPQGEFTVKIKAFGDGVNYGASDYVVIGKLVNTVIPQISIENFLNLTEEDTYKTFYELTGVITEILDPTGHGRVTIEQNGSKVYMHNLAEKKGGTPDSFANIGVKVGDTIVIHGTFMIYSQTGAKQVGDAYFVSKKENILDQFLLAKTYASLNVGYIVSQVPYQEPTYSEDTYTFSTQNVNNGTPVENFTFTSGAMGGCAKGTNDSGLVPKIYYGAARMYKGNTMDILYEDTPSQLCITLGENNRNFANVTVEGGTYDSNTGIITIDDPTLQSITITATNKIDIAALTFKTVNGEVTKYKDHYEIAKEENSADLNKVALRFGSSISSELYNQLIAEGTTVKFGVAYVKASELNGKTFDAAIADKTAHFEECTPALQNDQYLFSITINHIPTTSFNDEVTAACYVEIDGQIHLMQTKQYSVNTIANYYVTNEKSNQDVINNKGMLEWLANYIG